jgi:hypothetical protein
VQRLDAAFRVRFVSLSQSGAGAPHSKDDLVPILHAGTSSYSSSPGRLYKSLHQPEARIQYRATSLFTTQYFVACLSEMQA